MKSEQPNTLKASIVIRTYNEAKHIAKLIYGIGEQDHDNYEIIIVDSGSNDGTLEEAQSVGLPIKIVPIAKKEFSFGRALNKGCEAATGDILVFVSGHVYPLTRSWLRLLLEPFEDEKTVLSYGCQRGNEINKFSEHQIFAKWFPVQSDRQQLGYFCNNANCAVRRDAWAKLPYDEHLPGLEDLDWAKKAQADGGEIAYQADATIVHVHDETWPSVRNRYRREAIAMSRIEESFHVSFLDYLWLTTTNIAMDLREAKRQKVLLKEWKSILLFRHNQFYGAFKGYNERNHVTAELRDRLYFPNRRGVTQDGSDHAHMDDVIDYMQSSRQ